MKTPKQIIKYTMRHPVEMDIGEGLGDRTTPESKLIIAMLKRAILDLHSPSKEVRKDAYNYLAGKEKYFGSTKKGHPFGARRCCEHLGLPYSLIEDKITGFLIQ